MNDELKNIETMPDERAIETSAAGALKVCLDAVKGGALIPLGLAALDWLQGAVLKELENNIFKDDKGRAVWRLIRDDVIAAGSAVGQVAHILATVANKIEIDEETLKKAVYTVRTFCAADVPPKDRKAVCPPDPGD